MIYWIVRRWSSPVPDIRHRVSISRLARIRTNVSERVLSERRQSSFSRPFSRVGVHSTTRVALKHRVHCLLWSSSESSMIWFRTHDLPNDGTFIREYSKSGQFDNTVSKMIFYGEQNKWRNFNYFIPPKRRCWKDEQKVKSGCSKNFSRSWVLYLGN